MHSDFDFDPSYGYSLDQLMTIKPPDEPDDFDQFWQSRYKNSLNIPPKPELKDTGTNQSGWRIFKIQYQSSRDFMIHGWLLLPENGIIKRGFVIGHGYGGREEPDFHLPFKNAALLFPCFRGLSLSQQAPISNNPFWHVLHDIDKLEQYIIGGCVEDVWTGVNCMLRLFPHLAGHLAYMGISFGGGVGALAMAYDHRLSKGHVNVPAFGHQPLRLKLPTLGSADSQQQFYHQHKEHNPENLAYYDAAIAAKRIQQPLHCACAVFDPFVAPPGQFAIHNAQLNNRQLMILEAGHHNYKNQLSQGRQLLKELKTFFSKL